MSNIYPVLSGLTGGTAGKLDAIDGADLNNGDAATVVIEGGVYHYHLDSASGATENSPFRINPDTNAGTKSWHLVGTTARVGALVYKDTVQAIADSTWDEVEYEQEDYDDASFWSVSNPTRLTIPIGVTAVRLTGNVYWTTNSTGVRKARLLKDNTSEVFGGFYSSKNNTNDTGDNLESAIIDVSATEYFEISAQQLSGGSLNITADGIRNWFSIEAVRFA